MKSLYPEAEVDITEDLARGLIDGQFPQFKNERLAEFASGWDNVNYRLGSKYLVRIPRREVGARTIENEITWLRKLDGILPVKTPSPIHIGRPTDKYPWRWAINPWFDGEPADVARPNLNEAKRLVDFLKTLHSFDAKGAPFNPFRSVPLVQKAEKVDSRLENIKSENGIISDKVLQLWEQAKQEKIDSPTCLIHGDLHSKNMIVKDGQLEAVIDWGDIALGDRSSDLACLWMLYEDEKIRKAALIQYGASYPTVIRAQGWAIFYGVILVSTSIENDQSYVSMGKRILRNISGSEGY